MDNKIEVLNRLLDEINLSLQQVCDRIDMLSNQKQEISQNLKELYNNEDNLEKRKKVLEEIISDEKLKSSSIKINDDDGVIVGMDMGKGPDMTVVSKNKDLISSPISHNLYEKLINEREVSMEIMKRMERDHKHGKV